MFRKLKEKFIKEPVLVAPDLDKKMRMEVNALDYATRIFYLWSVRMESGDQWYFFQNL